MQDEYINGRVRVYRTVDDVLTAIKRREGCGSIRYVIVFSDDELAYIQNRRLARESF